MKVSKFESYRQAGLPGYEILSLNKQHHLAYATRQDFRNTSTLATRGHKGGNSQRRYPYIHTQDYTASRPKKEGYLSLKALQIFGLFFLMVTDETFHVS
jgi:hypothetical protein